MSKYKLIEQLGLEVSLGHREHPESPGYTAYVNADQLERVLEQAPVYYGGPFALGERMIYGELPGKDCTHSARLLNIQPIVRDSAESLLRELIKTIAVSWKAGKRDIIGLNDNKRAWDLYDRARKLLEKSDET